MSMTLNLVDRLLAMGRKFQALGRDHDARQVLGRLARFGELPGPVAEETQVRLAEMLLKKRKFRRARRHLTAALVHQPDHARYHHLLATALDAEDRGDPERAAEHYRKSLELDPQQPRCLGEYGLLALRLGRTEEGLDALRRAAELAPDDARVLETVADGLRQEGLVDEARTLVRAALFRNPKDARFRKLRNDFEYAQLRQEQQARGLTGRAGRAADDGPVLLPFVRPAPDALPLGGTRKVRRHRAVPPPGPHLGRGSRQSDQKRAQ